MKMKKMCIAVALASLPFGNQSWAQEDEIFLQEIIVTASKREKTLQDTPVSVSVVTADTIKIAHIRDFIDLQSVVPSLRVSQQTNTASTNYVIRGFGNGAVRAGVEPSVGVFIDGVYRSRAAATINDLPRLERVEVLGGPQSTLFGKNASAGVISVVTPTPSGDAGGYISGSVGNYNLTQLKGLYEGAVSDTTSFDLYGSMNKRDGFFENEALGTDLNDRDRFNVRGQLYYEPSEKTSWRILADYSQIDESCCNIVNVVSGPTTPIIQALGGQVAVNDPAAEKGFFDQESSNEITNSGISLQLNHDFDGFTLTSISAARNSENLTDSDIDGTSARLFNSASNDIEVDTFSQEVRLTSNNSGKFDWLIGGYYFREDINADTEVVFGPAFRSFIDIGLQQQGFPLSLPQVEGLTGIPQGSIYANNSGSFENFSLENEALSVFSQVDFSLSDNLLATLGLNYTKDKKEFDGQQTITEVRNNLVLPGQLNLIPALLPQFNAIPNPVESNETDDDELTYTARLTWAATEDINLYTTYATGFKASSINLSRDSSPIASDLAQLRAAGLARPLSTPGTRFAGPEETTLVEVGMKALFDKWAVNVALFDQEIEGFQTLLFTGSAFSLVNAGQQSVKGAEIDVTLAPTDALTFGLKATLLDPVYDEFSSNPGGDLTGEQVAAISELSMSLSAQYDFLIGDYEAFFRGDFQYVEDAPLLQGFSTDIASSEIQSLNVSAGLKTTRGLSFIFWARNLTDDEHLWSIFPALAQPETFSGFRNEPRTFGVTLRKDF